MTNNIFNKIKNRIKEYSPVTFAKKKELYDKLKNYIDEARIEGAFANEKYIWGKNFRGFIAESSWSELNYISEVLYGFFEEPIIPIKILEKNSNLVYISAIKNDKVYIKEILTHYRKLGVSHFVFIDNNSEDDSIDFLLKQNDVSVLKAPYEFNGRKKVGWKLQAIAIFGLNRWYLWMDSDEFLVYPNYDNISLPEYIAKLEEEGIDHVKGFMLDMYPTYGMMNECFDEREFITDYRYFDAYSNYYKFNAETKVLTGGMRARVLDVTNLKLDKTPIAFCKDGLLFSGNHTVYPKSKNCDALFGCVLKHYKFLPSDLKKYQNIVRNNGAGYFDLSTQKKYVDIIEQEGEMTAFSNEYSILFETYSSLESFSKIMKKGI